MEGECHFLEGNKRAKMWVDYTKGLLEESGIAPDRLKMFNLSSSMAPKFKEVVEEMVEVAKKLGPTKIEKKAA